MQCQGNPVNICFNDARCWDGGWWDGSPVCCSTTYEIWSNGLFQDTDDCMVVGTAGGCGMDRAFQAYGGPGSTLQPKTCERDPSCDSQCAGNGIGYSLGGTCYYDEGCSNECCTIRRQDSGGRCVVTEYCNLNEIWLDKTCWYVPEWGGDKNSAWYRLPSRGECAAGRAAY